MPHPSKRWNSHSKNKNSCPILASRREERKQERLAKKQRNIQRNQSRGGKGTDVNESPVVVDKKKTEKKVQPVKKKNQVREEEMKKQRFRQIRKQLKDDDKVIRQLEKKLRLNRRKGRKAVPKSFYDEGLGDILDFIDKRVDPDDDRKQEKEEQISENEDDEDQEMSDDADDQNEESDEDSDVGDEKEIEFEVDSDADEEDNDSEDEDDDEVEEADQSEEMDDADEDAQVVEPVVDKIQCEPLDPTLMRRIRGQLNRITSANLPSISSFIENMYRENSSFQVNESMCRCIDSLLVVPVTLSPLKLVTELCLLIASLHENIGDEVGGHAIHYFVKAFKSQFDSNDQDMECKKLDNLVAILCNLYAVSLIDVGLFYEITSEIVSRFDEKSIELLLFVLTSVGFLMRKDSPDRMKNLIRDIQMQANKSPGSGVSKRTEFMLETLTEIKNNNIIKVTSRASSVVSPINRDELKGILKNCLKRSTKVTAIPATLKQALSSNRWWIKVGPGLIENQANRDSSDKRAKQEKYEFALESEVEERLCRSLRLNTTPLRRSLFKAVISSADYVEAADRLVSLCKKNQCIEAANVLIQIAIHETKVFNPFYVHVLKRLASFDRQYKVSIFYAVKDRLSDVPSFSDAKKRTFVQLVFQLMREKVISLAVVKGLEFASLTEPLVIFLKDLLTLVMDQDEKVMKEMFERIPKKDHMLMASIRLFISCFMDEKSQSMSRDLISARIKLQT